MAGHHKDREHGQQQRGREPGFQGGQAGEHSSGFQQGQDALLRNQQSNPLGDQQSTGHGHGGQQYPQPWQQQPYVPQGYGGYGGYGGTAGVGLGWQGGGHMERSQEDEQEHYRYWRQQQMLRFDRDFENWRDERRRKFANEFDKWRQEREGQLGSQGTGAMGDGEPGKEHK